MCRGQVVGPEGTGFLSEEMALAGLTNMGIVGGQAG